MALSNAERSRRHRAKAKAAKSVERKALKALLDADLSSDSLPPRDAQRLRAAQDKIRALEEPGDE